MEKNYNSSMKYLILLLFALNLFSIWRAQNSVNLTAQIPQPYSPYIADYYEGRNNSMLIIKNNDNAVHRVKIGAVITGDNGITISTKMNFMPATPIILSP